MEVSPKGQQLVKDRALQAKGQSEGVGACQAAEADGHIPSNADDERLETVLGTLMHNEPQRAQA